MLPQLPDQIPPDQEITAVTADGWRDVYNPVIARYATRDILWFFLADAR